MVAVYPQNNEHVVKQQHQFLMLCHLHCKCALRLVLLYIYVNLADGNGTDAVIEVQGESKIQTVGKTTIQHIFGVLDRTTGTSSQGVSTHLTAYLSDMHLHAHTHIQPCIHTCKHLKTIIHPIQNLPFFVG